ncbi:hypothetical protein LTR37_007419 [Vermiconidia calcicola]|uniref:Uncharacterized protein n=1 Tax=Vermiconidia calcicola TaxID=1690605 RepID=A0ACC3NEI6_9PEZI|nr:hypothetical protein LTR37_007419 [Vermiconidia calcicola]
MARKTKTVIGDVAPDQDRRRSARVRQKEHSIRQQQDNAQADELQKQRRDIHHKALQIALPDADQDSRLLRLPAELRNRIYSLALVQESHIEIKYFTLKPASRRSAPKKASKLGYSPSPPGFLQVSQEVRTEATKIYYGANAFFSRLQCALRVWLWAIGECQRTLLRDIRGFDTTWAADYAWESLVDIESVEGGLMGRV